MVSYIRGIDYVSQNDIMPYTSTESVPIIHDLFNKLFNHFPNKSNLVFFKMDYFNILNYVLYSRAKYCWK
jgi:hypothetical protein